MKLSPIKNPHAKISKDEKISLEQERKLILMQTKQDVIQKYSKQHNKPVAHDTKGNSSSSPGKKDEKFKLGEKVTKDSQGIKLLQQGYLQSFIDYIYLTNETTPSVIVPSKALSDKPKSNKYSKSSKSNKRNKDHLDFSEESLVRLSEDLVDAELYLRDGNTVKCINSYEGICKAYERLNDYETASYFYERILNISREAKYVEGETQAYIGLGICEEQVLNTFEAMKYHETALEKAIDGNLPDFIKAISQQLVKVYK